MGSVWHLISVCLSTRDARLCVCTHSDTQTYACAWACTHASQTLFLLCIFMSGFAIVTWYHQTVLTLLLNLKSYSSCDLINFWWFLDPLNREVVVEIAQRPIFSKGSSRVYISMKPSFHLQLKSGSPLPSYPEAVTSSTDEAFKEWLWPTSHILGCSVILHASLVVMLKIFCAF